MKRFTIIFLLIVAGLFSSGFGQDTPGSQDPAQKAARQTASLATLLNLNQDQQQEVLCAYQTFFEDRKKLFEAHAQSNQPSDGFRLQLHHKRQACHQKVFSVLTSTQAKTYQEYLDGLKPRRGG